MKKNWGCGCAVLAAMVLIILGYVAFYCGAAYVVVHFIQKFW
jgi:hypothetical protein